MESHAGRVGEGGRYYLGFVGVLQWWNLLIMVFRGNLQAFGGKPVNGSVQVGSYQFGSKRVIF